MTKFLYQSLILAGLMLCSIVTHGQFDNTVSASPSPASTTQNIRINASGFFSDGCYSYRSLTWSRSGSTITVFLNYDYNSSGGFCPQVIIEYSGSVTIGQLPAGNYTIRLRDGNNQTQLASASLTVSQTSRPNLTCGALGSVTVDAANIRISNFNVQNIGNASAAPSSVGYYLSTNTIISSSDYLIGESSVGLIVPGGSERLSKTISLSSINVPNGTYYLGVLVDNREQVGESSGSDNDCYWSSPRITFPVQTVNLSCQNRGSLNINEGSLSISNLQVRNNGSANASRFSIGIYLSSNTTITTSDSRIGSISVGSLAAGSTTTRNFSYNLNNANVSNGNYYVGFIIDHIDEISETNESDNVCYWTNPRVSLPIVVRTPDLACDNRGTLNVNDNILQISNSRIINNGDANAGSFRVGYYLSTNTSINSSDILIGSRFISSLSQGNTNTGSLSINLDNFNIPDGTYYVGILIDDQNDIGESNESNNNDCYWTNPRLTFPRVVASPNLSCGTQGNLRINGNIINITGTEVRNTGNGSAGTSALGFYLSTDTNFDFNDLRIGERFITNIPAGGSESRDITIDLSNFNIQDGEYYVGTIIDFSNRVQESNENDNNDCFWTSPKVVIGAPISCIDPSKIDPNGFCPLNYDPVCGCDGVTYSNSCFAENAGVTQWTQGACAGNACIDPSKIDPNALCPLNYDPVCGCDGVTYSNSCFAENAGVTQWTQGECAGNTCIDPSKIDPNALCPLNYDPVCGCDGVTYSNSCFAENAGVTQWTQGECAGNTCIDPSKIDPKASCTLEIDPVCGCNGVTYSNPCLAEKDGVTQWIRGACGNNESCVDSTAIDPDAICTQEIDWVCGCDGKNYINPCYAQAAGISKFTKGICSDTICVDTNLISREEVVCPTVENPVCGCNGVTYSNSCFAQVAGVTKWTAGTCTNNICGLDLYEPNQVIASYLTPGKFHYGLICPTGDYDWFYFYSTADKPNIQIKLSELPADYDVFLYDASFNKVAESIKGSTANEEITLNNQSGGQLYYVLVNAYNNASVATNQYKLRIDISGLIFVPPITKSKRSANDINSKTPKLSQALNNLPTTEFNGGTLSLTSIPNPNYGQTDIQYTLPADTKVSLLVYDIQGRIVQTILNEAEVSAGFHTTNINISHLKAGMYFCRLVTTEDRITHKIILIK